MIFKKKIDILYSGDDMNRIELAKENFKNGFNCAQAVVGAYCDLFGVPVETGLMISEGFGGGMGRMRLTCGAVTGMFILAGMQYSGGKTADMDARKKVYATVQEMAKAFEEKNGSIICADLLGLNLPKDNSATPTARTPEFYQKRPCVDCVGDCAMLVEKILLGK